MKVWEKARDKELEKLENEIRQKWEDFSKTGECQKIECKYCPIYDDSNGVKCRVRQPFHDDVHAREILNKEI